MMNVHGHVPYLTHLTRICLGLGALTFSNTALSQALEEIVVTAQRVESNVQRTAIAMDVLNSDALKDQGINSVTQLSAVSPSVNVTGFGGGTVVTVRGISSRDTTEIGDPAVVVNVDGFYQDRSYALGLTQYDLERIEVLRGPQGTLYGRNATGGAINIVTTRPGKEFGGYAQLGIGNYDAINTEGAINIPLNDRVQMRASFTSQFQSGYRDGGFWNNSDDANARSGRLQFAFQPTDSLDLRLTAQHTVQTANGSAAEQIPYRVDAGGFVIHDMPVHGDPGGYPKAFDSRLHLDDTTFRWDATYRASWATVTYLGGYSKLNWDSLSPAFFFPTPATDAVPFPAFQVRTYNQTEEPKTTNHELRLISANQDARFTWQAGVYYFKNENDLDSFNFSPNGTAAPTPVIHFLYDVKIDSLAEMVHLGFRLTDTFRLTAGYRHNEDEKARSGYIFFAQTLPPNANRVTVGTEIEKDTYHAGLEWQVTPDTLLYGKFDTGYKSGGFTDLAAYGPESVDTWEIGAKNRFFNDTMQLNVAAYRSDYTGQQVQQIIQGLGGGLRIVNAGETRLQGLEAEFAMAGSLGRLEINLAYLDAEFTDFVLATGIPRFNGTAWTSSNVNLQLAGNHPQQAPEWTIGAAVEHTFGNFIGGSLTTRLQTKYQSEQFYTFFNRPNDTQESHAVTNFLATWAPAGGPWQVQFYVNNLSDEVVFSNAGPNDRAFNYSYSYQPPRTYGGRLSYRW